MIRIILVFVHEQSVLHTEFDEAQAFIQHRSLFHRKIPTKVGDSLSYSTQTYGRVEIFYVKRKDSVRTSVYLEAFKLLLQINCVYNCTQGIIYLVFVEDRFNSSVTKIR